MKHFLVVIALLLLCGCATRNTRKIYVVTACDLYSDPEKFDRHLVEVVGKINVQFESSNLLCFIKEAKTAPLNFGIWVGLDLESIRQKSPEFYPMIAAGCEAAKKSEGGLIGEIRFRGHFILSKDWIQLPESKEPKQRLGFGHFGMYGAKVVVEEVLEYKSTLKN